MLEELPLINILKYSKYFHGMTQWHFHFFITGVKNIFWCVGEGFYLNTVFHLAISNMLPF